MPHSIPVGRALISVSDKSGLLDLARALAARGVELISTGGTAQALRMATAAQDGMARAIVPSHTPFDGDLVFAVSTGARPLPDPAADAFLLGHAAACCLARAIARAVYLAAPMAGDLHPAWSARHGRR